MNYLALLASTLTNTVVLVSGLPKLDVLDVIPKAKKKQVASHAPKNKATTRTDKQMPIQNTPIQMTANDSTYA